MTPEQVLALGVAFAAYLRRFEACFAGSWTLKHLHTHCRLFRRSEPQPW